MGISQLLPLLEKSTRSCSVSEFRGQTVAVDSYCWLHKGARSCALQLAKGEKTDAYVQYCVKYIDMLLSYDIKPVMVFDGRPLPAKAGTERKRRESKSQAWKQGMEYLRLGQSGDAYKSFCQCIDVTPQMALDVIKMCRKMKIDYIVAPYESDAQLAFLSIRNMVDCVISEDSDLLLFGCKRFLERIPRYLNMKNLTVSEEYKENFLVADATFVHQVVFDTIKKTLTHLHEVGDNAQYCTNAGEIFDEAQAFQLAIGNLNPLNMERIDNWDHSERLRCASSIWSAQYSPPRKPMQRYKPSQNLLSKNIDLKTIETMKERNDEVVEKELEFYKSPVKVHVALIEHNSPESPPTPESQISPVLGNNPFIKKKISKFQVTKQNSRQKVISRFFSSDVVGIQGPSSSYGSSSASPVFTSESGYDERVVTSEDDVSSTVTSNGNSLEASSSGNLSLKVNVGGSSQTDTETTDTSDEPPQVECECILEEEDGTVSLAGTSTTLTSVENIPIEPPAKRRKFQVVPKGKKRSSNQPTIQDMFKKMRMN